MNPFVETSFLCSLYRGDLFSEKADAWTVDWNRPLPVSSLVRFEFRQSLRLQTRLYVSNPKIGLSPEAAHSLLRQEEEDFRSGVLDVLPVDWPSVHERADQLSDKYTWDDAHRFADILHVATALCCGRDTFLTFDNRQAQMAKSEGLEVPFHEKNPS